MSLISRLNRPQFYLHCVGYYCILALYFIGVKIFLHGTDLFKLPQFLEYGLGIVLFLATSFLAMRVDLLWLSYHVHLLIFERGGYIEPQSKSMFYLKVFGYYLFLIVGLAVLFALRNDLHFFIFYYLTFLAASVAMANFDYLFPSYQRYQRSLDQGRWGMVGRMGAGGNSL